MREALAISAEEGLKEQWQRHEAMHHMLWDGLKSMGLKSFVDNDSERLITVNTIKVMSHLICEGPLATGIVVLLLVEPICAVSALLLFASASLIGSTKLARGLQRECSLSNIIRADSKRNANMCVTKEPHITEEQNTVGVGGTEHGKTNRGQTRPSGASKKLSTSLDHWICEFG